MPGTGSTSQGLRPFFGGASEPGFFEGPDELVGEAKPTSRSYRKLLKMISMSRRSTALDHQS